MNPIHEMSIAQTYYPGAPEPVARKVRLLLADDNSSMRRQVCSLLAEDFDIVAALADGESVLREYHELEPEALILDISMGEMSGLEVARHLRERGNVAPIIFLTVHEETDFLKAALASGGSAYVVKSHLSRDLIPAINAALAGELFISPHLLHLL